MDTLIDIIYICLDINDKINLGLELFKVFHEYIGGQLMEALATNIEIDKIDSLMYAIFNISSKGGDKLEFLVMGEKFLRYIVWMVIRRRYLEENILEDIHYHSAAGSKLLMKLFMGFVRVEANNNATILEVFKIKVRHNKRLVQSFKKQIISRLVQENNDFLSLGERSIPNEIYARRQIFKAIAVFSNTKKLNDIKKQFS